MVTITNSYMLKELSHNILSDIDHIQHYLEIEGNLKIVVHKERKTLKR